MNSTVVIALDRFFPEAEKIAFSLDADICRYEPGIFEDAFTRYRTIVAVMSAGIVVRTIAPLLSDKWRDPAVVVVSPDLKFAIPVIGGHHGANEIASRLGEIGIQPVISTATETQGLASVEGMAKESGRWVINRDSTRAVNAGILDGKTRVYTVEGPAVILAGSGVSFLSRPGTYSVGLGCRQGTPAGEIEAAVREALNEHSIPADDVMVYATTERKLGEPGLIRAVECLDGCLIFLADETIRAEKAETPSAAGRIGLPGVAEPAALAVSRRKELVMKKKVSGRVTIAIAR